MSEINISEGVLFFNRLKRSIIFPARKNRNSYIITAYIDNKQFIIHN